MHDSTWNKPTVAISFFISFALGIIYNCLVYYYIQPIEAEAPAAAWEYRPPSLSPAAQNELNNKAIDEVMAHRGSFSIGSFDEFRARRNPRGEGILVYVNDANSRLIWVVIDGGVYPLNERSKRRTPLLEIPRSSDRSLWSRIGADPEAARKLTMHDLFPEG